MKSDIQIAQENEIMPIVKILEKCNIPDRFFEPYGHYKAKVSYDYLTELKEKDDAKLVLVTAINPTPAGEGKTTTTIGLTQALNKLNKNAIAALREPSLGPCMGVKGGAAGGGYAQVIPMEDINLHFTGDIHAITTAHNLLSAMIDNHLQQGNVLNIDVRQIAWKRVMDMNDRALRNIVVGLGGKPNGMPREDHFIISVASEVMAILCLAENLDDLKEKLGNIIIGYSYDNKAVTAKELKANGAMTVLLKDALKPNLVQTLEHTPVFIHGGPFANIAHGCNSVLATKTALKIADIVITEAGFGADLGAEKFFDIKCRKANLKPDCVVLVATVRALKYNGGVLKADLGKPDVSALKKGFVNLKKHIENIKKYNLPVIVTINHFDSDTKEEVDFIVNECKKEQVEFSVSNVWKDGGDGGIDLANKVIDAVSKPNDFKLLYEDNLTIKEKIEKICTEIYGADGVKFSSKAIKDMKRIDELGFNHFPVCIAKTQYSLSDNPNLLGKPEGFTINVSELNISAGAGFIVALTGNIMTMPGLPKVPSAASIDIDADGNVVGLF